ncbi:MAG: sulfatase-like hydrolase/transferase [Pseudomonadota bacterium]
MKARRETGIATVFGLLQTEPTKERTVFAVHLCALCAFAIAQPLYDLIARNADFLTAHHLGPFDIVILTLLAAAGPPLLLTLTESAAALFLGAGTRRGLHLVFVAGLAALIVLPLLKRFVQVSASVNLASAFLIGLAVTVSYVRFSTVRTFFTLSALAVIVFPLTFLFLSPVSQIVFGRGDASGYGGKAVRSDVPIVFIVFDEFPATSIMDAEGNIDVNALPNFAKLAKTSTWYRNASTVSDYTTAALPAMLTGTYPTSYRLPHVSNYPGNLFTLLGPSYRMNVIEPFTDLCPAYLLSDDVAGGSFFDRFKALGSDLSLIYLHYLLPAEWTGSLPDVTKTLKNFADGSRAKRSKESRIKYFDLFLQGIRDTSKPSLNFLHIMFPHVPWVYYPSGKRYNDYAKGFAGIFGLEEEERWKDDEWAVNSAYQRHLLQVGFVDKLLGRLLETLKNRNLFDRSLIVVTADHGVSFVSGDNRRRLTEKNFPDIAGVPLFIKAPFQRKGVLDDCVVESIDILPTIASILGIEVPWPVNGISLTSGAPTRTKRTVFHYGERVDDSKKVEQAPALNNQSSQTLKRKTEIFGSDPDLEKRYFTFGPHRDLIGSDVSRLMVEPRGGDVELLLDNEGFFAEMDHAADFLFGNISGVLKARNPRRVPSSLAIAVNGTIRAVTRTIPVGDDAEAFSAVVPENSFRSGDNAVDVFSIESGTDGRVTLEPLRKARAKAYAIALPTGGITEVLESGQGDRIPVIHGSLVGRLDRVVRGESGDSEFIGWAADKTRSQPAGDLLVFADGKLVRTAGTNWHMPAVARFLGGPEFVNSGFWFSLPTKLLKNVKELRLFAVSRTDPKTASELNYFRGYQWAPKPGRFTVSGGKETEPAIAASAGGARIPVKSGAVDGRVESTAEEEGGLVVAGWAAEANRRGVPHTILVVAGGDSVLAAKPSVFRKDIAERFNAPQLLLSGFKIKVPSSVLKGSKGVRVFGVSHDGIASEIAADPMTK